MSIYNNIFSVYRFFLEKKCAVTVTSLSEFSGIPKNSASRLLNNMLDSKLIKPDEKRGYLPGDDLLALAESFKFNFSLEDLMIQSLTKICKKTGFTGYISQLEFDIVFVAYAQLGSKRLPVVTQQSVELPAISTSTGRILLSRLTRKELKPFLPEGKKEFVILNRTLETIYERGWSQSINEALRGVTSISCAVHDPNQDKTLAMCISLPSNLSTTDKVKELIEIVYTHARKIGLQIGDKYWQDHPEKPFLGQSG